MSYEERRIILLTGCAGFIGAALTKKFLKEGYKVIGIDNLNKYYDVKLKNDRLKDISDLVETNKFNWQFFDISLEDEKSLKDLFFKFKPQIVINMAAQAGVRYSIENPESYFRSNQEGFFNILNLCKQLDVEHLVYASSSSVYGSSDIYPFTEDQSANEPLSFYAATKKSNEIMAHAFSNIYKMSITGLRFFTVYGPWGRPDMAPMIFSKKILSKQPISVFNFGDMSRDFTYISDIINATFLCSLKPPQKVDKLKKNYKKNLHNIFNVGYGQPVSLLKFINLLEDAFSIKAIKSFEPIPKGDVIKTYANTKKLEDWIRYKPKISIEEGVEIFVNWYRNYFL